MGQVSATRSTEIPCLCTAARQCYNRLEGKPGSSQAIVKPDAATKAVEKLQLLRLTSN